MVKIIAILLVIQLALISAFQHIISSNKYIYSTRIPTINDNRIEDTSSYTTSLLSIGLYEEDIDWDSDLFIQIGKSTNKQVFADTEINKDVAEDDKQWDLGEGSNSKSVKSMREQMKQSWGGNDSTKKKEDGKPTADWAGAGGGPDEDEPWFTIDWYKGGGTFYEHMGVDNILQIVATFSLCPMTPCIKPSSE